MQREDYFYNCSEQYVQSIALSLHQNVLAAIGGMRKRPNQKELNADLWWLLTSMGWSYDSMPSGLPDRPADDLGIADADRTAIQHANQRDLCLTSATLGAQWRADFAKVFDGQTVQVEAQFGTVESMFKDFCGFRIASYERRISLGIEIVMSKPNEFFAHRKKAIAGMAYFDVAKRTLPAIGLDCPIWLIGLRE